MSEANADKKAAAKKAAPKKKAAPRKVRTPFGGVNALHATRATADRPAADTGVPKDHFVEVMNMASRHVARLRYMDVDAGAGKRIRALVIEDRVFGVTKYVGADGGSLGDVLSKLK